MKTPRAIAINWLSKFFYLRDPLAMISDPPKTRDWWPDLEDLKLSNTAVVVLNTSIENPPKLVRHLWNNSWLRVTVDGGTNKWHSFVKQNSFDDLKFPDLITGDLDSANPAVVEQFVSMGSTIIPTPNQDETDFTKALKEVKKYSEKNCKSIDSIIVMVNMCHRVDHFLSNLNTLYKSKTKDHYFDEDIYLLGRNSLTWLLQAGTHRIHVPQLLRFHPENNYVGFFPMGSACNECTTTGLKWNLSGKLMEMGGLTSSSNTFNGEPIVTITNSSPLLWTMTMGYEESF
ncbi:thiamin pyrophosphokinase 1-like isoform X1 [Rhopalosiphum maidis]|uniref:thiamin pyrophosphokinase 1-like isoform X1 n=2 Tax=Rhopalosiphum maidis TaxID=43146 RepID=UPI000EFDE798|nr:thiamin pyrophosphokinase 1-like isoform X1 [Rhopalosiphum maidis]XP_026817236.1 thiamin pyrophosphokinase 1-like isoform X1 [Rhopalosiphum maidis]